MITVRNGTTQTYRHCQYKVVLHFLPAAFKPIACATLGDLRGLRRTADYRRIVDFLGPGQTTETDGEGFDVHIPIVVSLLVILVVIMAPIGASLLATRGRKSSGERRARRSQCRL